MTANAHTELKIFVVVGEESGDQLGASLMNGLSALRGKNVSFFGIGGGRMAELGLTSLFPLSDIAVMGLSAVLERLPTIIRRVYQTVDAVIEANPDVLIIIDSPDFTHSVAKRVRKRAPNIPIVDYVSPSVWAWRSGRAKKMARYVDHLLAILPFEPEVHQRLGGPSCSYVGHPLTQKFSDLRPVDNNERRDLCDAHKPVLLMLPGSRTSEIERLLDPFQQTLEALVTVNPELEVIIPAVPHLSKRIEEKTASWSIPVEVVVGENQKFAAFRRAHAALVASGTASLELALSGVPMVVAYKVDWFYRQLHALHKIIPIGHIDSMVLPNIILGKNVVPEFLNDAVQPGEMASVLEKLLTSGPERQVQLDSFALLEDIMRPASGKAPGELAAEITLQIIGK
ncbi:MAG: lipid-A-disaccharide synthase [Stappiaceae bacterium]